MVLPRWKARSAYWLHYDVNEGRLDISQRGGKQGFVCVVDNGRQSVLTLPDFTGHLLFNTLGVLGACRT